MRRLVTAAIVCSLALVGKARAQDIDMGETYHALDRQVTRVTSWYADTYVISERQPHGPVRTRLFDRRTRALLAVSDFDDATRPGTARLVADIEGQPVEIAHPAVRARGTDWHNAQLQRLRRDLGAWRRVGRRGTPRLVADQGVWRVADVLQAERRSKRPSNVEEEEPEAVATEFADAVAIAERDEHDTAIGRGRVARSRFTSRMLDADGHEVGFVRWYDKERVLTWSFPNGRRGVAMESRVPGGFTFTPTLGWANIQARAFLEQSRRPRPLGPAALAPQALGATPGPASDNAPASCGPSAADDEVEFLACDGRSDGCTGLHFLDRTIFRECCDRHDLCYEADHPDGCCSAWSWFFPNPFWHCARCNFSAVWCFLTRGGGEREPWESPPLQECERMTAADWCAPECSTCKTRLDPESGR